MTKTNRLEVMQADQAWQKFDHWFFKECNQGTRRHLFALFGLPVDEVRNHGHERHCLRFIRKALNPPIETNTRTGDKIAWAEKVEADTARLLSESFTNGRKAGLEEARAAPQSITPPEGGELERVEERKFYRSEWPLGRLLEARGTGLLIDDGEAWRYRYSHKDATGEYDLLYRPGTAHNPIEQPTWKAAKAIAATAVQSACESDPADADHPDTILISTDDLETIVRCAVENHFEVAALSTPVVCGKVDT